VSYECTEGHTLTGKPEDPKATALECGADGEFAGATPKCLPVECGVPPEVPHATYADQRLTFEEQVMYECKTGHTLTGKASDGTKSSMACGASGEFLGEKPTCQPVECGAPPPVVNATYSAQELVYSEEVTYTCKDPLTIDGKPGGSQTARLTCSADGSFEGETPSCLPPPLES